jgi:hypothetical protein
MFILAIIVAVCAVATVLGLCVVQWVSVKADIRVLQATVASLDKQLALMIRSQLRLEALVVGVLGSDHPLAKRIREDT